MFENYPLGDALDPARDCYQIEHFEAIEYTNYPLTLAVMPGESLGFRLTYDRQRISGQSIENLWGHLSGLLLAFADDPEQPVGRVPMLTEAEIKQLQAWNDTATDYPQDKTLVDLFEAQVEGTPDHIAVVFEDESLSLIHI